MLQRTSFAQLLFLSGCVTLAGGVAAVAVSRAYSDQEYIPGQTWEYHPGASGQLAEATGTLDELGFTASPDAAHANAYRPAFVDGQSIAIGTQLSHSSIRSDAPSTVHAAITVLAREDGASDRAPLHVALVIDRSGSMSGDKIRNAKLASHALIDTLEARDRLSIITYSDEASTAALAVTVTSDTRPTLHAAIDQIGCTGGTNISAGLEQGREVVAAYRQSGEVGRVVLLSDGQATSGVQDAHGLGQLASQSLEQGVSVTTMGVGLDYDEDVMQAMATAGAGNYYFIKEGTTQQVFDQELGRLTSTVGTNTDVRIALADDVQFVTVHGFAFQRSGASIIVPLAAFAANERKDVLIELTVVPGKRGSQPLMTTTLTYTDPDSSRTLRQAQQHQLTVSNDGPALNVDVTRRVQQIRTIQAFGDAMRTYDNGDRFAAAKIIDDQRKQNRTFLDTLPDGDAAFERVEGELDKLAASLRKTERHSTEGKFISKATKFRANNAVMNQVVF